MALPVGLATFTLTGGPYTDATGAPALAGISGKLTPVDGAGRPTVVVHTASGAAIIPAPIPVTIAADGTWSIAGLPHTDDPALAAPFRYSMQWNVASSAPSPRSKVFEVAGSGATADFDLIAPVSGALATPTPGAVTSVVGQIGAITGAAIAADPAVRAAFVLPQTVDLAAGDATVTTVSRVMVLSGATATRTVTFPNASFVCEVRNDTDYPQTLKRTGATATLIVDSGSVIEMAA